VRVVAAGSHFPEDLVVAHELGAVSVLHHMPAVTDHLLQLESPITLLPVFGAALI